MKSVRKEILEKIKPNKKEQAHLTKITQQFLKKLQNQLKEAQAIPGGSSARQTWLAGSHDIDIFVQFPYQRYAPQSDKLSNLLEPQLKKAFPKEKKVRLHGSRDYFQITYQQAIFEVIPILHLKKAEQAVNITDVSPLHTQWVRRHGKKVRDDILLIKQFCKANNLYGAESYITGFSGYVLEILTVHYGSFEKVLQASRRWNVKDIIDPAHYYLKKMALLHLNQSKLQSPLIVIDPVDRRRNAAAALSLEKFAAFKRRAQECLKQPETSFFVKEAVEFSLLKKEAERKKQNLIYLEVDPLPGKRDLVGTQLLKAFQYLEQRLQPFDVKKNGWDWDTKAIFYFLLAKKELPHEEIRKGPPLELKEHAAEFRKKNKDSFVENGRLFAKVKVLHPRLKEYLERAIRHPYFRERIRGIKREEIW